MKLSEAAVRKQVYSGNTRTHGQAAGTVFITISTYSPGIQEDVRPDEVINETVIDLDNSSMQ